MHNPNNDGSDLEKSSQKKFAALTKLIKETQDVDTADLVKLKQKRDELVEMLKDINNTTSATSRDDNKLIRRKAEALIEKIDEKYLNATTKIPAQGLWDSLDKYNTYALDPVSKLPYFAATQPELFLAMNGTFAAALYAYYFLKAVDDLEKSLARKIRFSGGEGGLAPDEMREIFKEIMARKPLLEASQKAVRIMDATAREALMNNREFRKAQERLRQELEMFPASPEQKEQWQSTQARHEALQEYEARRAEPDGLVAAVLDAIKGIVARRRLAGNLPKPGQSPHDHLPEVMDKTKDEILAIYAAAEKANAAARESYGHAQAATRDRLLADREYREEMEQRTQELFPVLREVREDLKEDLESIPATIEAERENALNKAEKNDPAQPKSKLSPNAATIPAAYPPRLDTEYIAPVSHLRDPRNFPQPKEAPKYRYAGPFTAMTPGAMALMLARESAAAQPAAVEPNVTVTIERILPPPTHLADEDFRRCMQREIDKLVNDFDTGVRG